MAGIFSPITNDHRYFSSQIISTPVGTGGTSVFYVTVPFVSFGKVERVVVQSSSSYTGTMTMNLLNDGAGFRSSGDPSSGTATTLASNRIGNFELYGTYYEDAYRSRYCYLQFSGSSAFATSMSFTISVEGTKQQPFFNKDWETVPAKKDYHNKVYRQNPDGSIDDMTQPLRQNASPHYVGNNKDTSIYFPMLTTSNDYIYIGSDVRFNTVLFEIPDSFRLPSGRTVLKQYWNGTGWTGITNTRDNTSDGTQYSAGTKTDGNGFNYSGIFNMAGTMSDWTPYDLPTDPLVVLRNGMNTGYIRPVWIENVNPRYWIRFNVSNLAETLAFTKIQIWQDH